MIRFTDRPDKISYPVVPGHEMAGEVYRLGKEAVLTDHLSVGDRVVVYPWIGCSQCPVCASGDSHLCSVKCSEMGFVLDGGYSEYVLVPHHHFVQKLPDGIPFSVGALLPCSGLTAYSALRKCLPVAERVRTWKRDVCVGVIGLGGLGQWTLKLAPFCLGKVKLFGIDISSRKMEVVEEQGLVDGTHLLSLKDSLEEQAQSFCEKFNSLDIVLDFVNSSLTFSFCLQLLSVAGIHVMVGLHGGLGELRLPLAALSSSSHTGSYVGSLGELKALLELVSEEKITFPKVKTYPLSEAGNALEDLEKGLLDGRAVISMEEKEA